MSLEERIWGWITRIREWFAPTRSHRFNKGRSELRYSPRTHALTYQGRGRVWGLNGAAASRGYPPIRLPHLTRYRGYLLIVAPWALQREEHRSP